MRIYSKGAIRMLGGTGTSKEMPYWLYKASPSINLPLRMWPSRTLVKAPRWCSVDLRDGNQALVDPMDPERKMALFEMLVELGFKEIEIGFPSASQTDYDFIRLLIEEDRIPNDVTIQVLVQCREDLIKRTYESIRGAKSVIIHFYNSTSELQRRIVFQLDKKGIIDIAVKAAELCVSLESSIPETDVTYEYSPESFTSTEPEYAIEICEAVMDVIEPTPERPLIVNLPATVENYPPNMYADVIEWFSEIIKHRNSIVLSLHPHNDRGTAIAAAEMGILAGADRVEGTLFGNGERTGNVDIITLALNLFSQGIDPKLYVGDIEKVRRVAEYATHLPVHPRHPYAGDLVYTAFSGSHQDAIKKGMSSIGDEYEYWEVPYLPIDPKHTGRNYEEIVRVNSQSGKAGVAYLINTEYGLDLPRRLQIQFSQQIQKLVESSGTEMRSEEVWKVFDTTYLDQLGKLNILSSELSTRDGVTSVVAQLLKDGEHLSVSGEGNGPIDALLNGLREEMGIVLEVNDYSEHALTSGSSASAVAYIETATSDGSVVWGVGVDSSILDASLRAVISAVNQVS